MIEKELEDFARSFSYVLQKCVAIRDMDGIDPSLPFSYNRSLTHG